jgi:hypothetical protein
MDVAMQLQAIVRERLAELPPEQFCPACGKSWVSATDELYYEQVGARPALRCRHTTP